MKTKAEIWDRVERDQVLNLSELAVASGYPRSALGAMKLPLMGGKISLSDFKRILHRRQDQRENLHAMPVKPTEAPAATPDSTLRSSPIGPTAEDLFYGREKA